MSFHSPHLLWLLVPLLLLFSWELARRATAGGAGFPKIARAWAGAFQVSLGSAHSTPDTRPRIWLWFGLAFCIVALARPQWGVIEEQVFDQSREVLIAVDLSRSMMAQDVKPSRLDRAKLLITSLLDGLKGERVGLVLFAGTSFLQSPLSADYEILREFLPSLKPEYLPEGGSNYRAMLETSIQAFGTSTADRYLIILSDGESTEEGWKEVGDALKNKGIRVIGLGIGTTQGSFIPDGGGAFVKDDRGAVVMSRLNSSTLQQLAQTTGGAYTDASAWVDLAALLRKTVEAGRKGEFSEKNTARLIERYQWFLAPGLFLLCLSFWAEFPVRPRERALPLGNNARRKTLNAKLGRAALFTFFLLAACSLPLTATAQEPAPASSEETLAKPLTSTVARLADQGALSAKDCSDLAQTTLTYGQRLKSSSQPVAEGIVQDALAAVDLGEKSDPQAADWPRLRRELEDLLEKPEQPPQQDQQEQKDQQNQQKDQQQNQQNQDQQKQDRQDQKQDQPQSDQQQQQQQQQQDKQEQDAFGDMKEPSEQPQSEEQDQPPPPQPQTQKVGGQKEKKQEMPLDPDLAVPLQKLDQVRNQDSPAKLQMLMQGKSEKPQKKGKDW